MAWLWVSMLAAPFALSLVLTRLMISLAPRIGLVDAPAARKFHAKTTPLGGGLAIAGAVLGSMLGVVLVAWGIQHVAGIADRLPASASKHAPGVLFKASQFGWIAVAGLVQMGLGLADDWRKGGLDYRLRLAVEVGLVSFLAWQGVSLKLFVVPPWVAGVLTVIWVVGLTNAINFLDNMDGLAGSVVFIASIFFAAVMALVGSLFVSASFLVVAGAVLGFLVFNWNPARIFMGDAGSNFLGFWMGMLTVLGTFIVVPFSPVTVFAPLCILAVPIYDSVSVITLRLSQGRSPFQPDKQHFSHRLVMLGLSPVSAVLVIALVCVTTGLSGLLLYFVSPIQAAVVAPLVVLQVICMLGVVALLEVAAHRRRRESSAAERP
jgi:UDP-GlcNAc:undecaprenyl-phosphate/decaprenyl-phosphate GlcNAc-1-phosphate transferase